MQTATTSNRSATSSRTRSSSFPWPAVIAALVMVYTFGVAWGLLGGRIPPERAYLLMALPCVAPMLWCGAGFFRELGSTRDGGEQDAGLLLSCVGWLLLGIGLLAKYFAIVRAMPDAYAAQASSPATPLCVVLGVLCLIIGAALSWFSWLREQD